MKEKSTLRKVANDYLTHTYTGISNKKSIVLIIQMIFVIVIMLNYVVINNLFDMHTQKKALMKSGSIDFSYNIEEKQENNLQIVIEISENQNGLDKIECPNGNIISFYGTKNLRAIDYSIVIGTEYKFKIFSRSGEIEEKTIKIEDSDIGYVNFYRAYTPVGTYDTTITSYSGNISVDNNQVLVEERGVILGDLHYLNGGVTPWSHNVMIYKNNIVMYVANAANRNLSIKMNVNKDDKIRITQYTDSSSYAVTGKAELVYIPIKLY